MLQTSCSRLAGTHLEKRQGGGLVLLQHPTHKGQDQQGVLRACHGSMTRPLPFEHGPGTIDEAA